MGKRSVSEEMKWQIVGLNKLKQSYRKIASTLGVSVGCVQTTLNNFKKTGHVKDKFRVGRPRMSTSRDNSVLFRLARANPTYSCKVLASKWQTGRGRHLSRRTVSRRLIEKKLNSYVAPRKPLLRVLDRLRRVRWCKERVNWSLEMWKRCVFSDESHFEVFNRKNRIYIRRLKSEKLKTHHVQPTIKGGGGSAGVWGCINFDGTGVLHCYDGRLNGASYLDVMENGLLPSLDIFFEDPKLCIFQQDNAPCHTAKIVTSWFDENNIYKMPWPANSPDLNPIEHLWSWLDQKIINDMPSSLDDLKCKLEKYWLEIPTDLCEKLVKSMPDRCKKCIKARGGYF